MIYLALIPLRGGGKRLIKNIINKYRLGNEYKEIKENIENKGSSNNSNFEYWYIKQNTTQEGGFSIPTLFNRGISVRPDREAGSGVITEVCRLWPRLEYSNNGYKWRMEAMEVIKAKYDIEQDGIVYIIDATDYNNYILSILKIFVSMSSDFPEEEMQTLINQLKEVFVEISKEEFEEIYNNAED